MDKNRLNQVASLALGIALIAGGIWIGQSVYKKNRILGGTVGGIAGLITLWLIPAPKIFSALGNLTRNVETDSFDGIRIPR